jgi:flavin-dependent trigonelline monooxygenase, reductase component
MTAPSDTDARGWTSIDSADTRVLRNLFGTFLTGVTIVTFRDATGSPRGFTANSFTSVSLDPPLVLVCVANTAGSYEALCCAERFAINILSDAQKNASAAFASRTGRRFDEVASWSREGGPPLIEGSLSSIECERQQAVQAGDHAIVIGRVLGFRLGVGQPLGYYSGNYVAFALGADVLEHLGGIALRIGCLVERGEQVLLVKRGGGHWEIPSLPLRAGEDHRQVVPRLLALLGVKAQVGFLYSVFQENGDPHTTLIFRAVAEDNAAVIRETASDGVSIKLFSQESVPWDDIAGRSQRAVVRRFFEERAQAKFGIYWDTDDGGRVAAVDGTPKRWQAGSDSSPTEI